MYRFECIKVLRGHDHNISSVEFAIGGDFIITASRDRTIRVWELSSGYNTKTISGHDDWVRKAGEKLAHRASLPPGCVRLHG